MQTNMHEAKSQLSQLAEKAARGGRVVIAKAGKPYVDLVPHQPAQPRQPGRCKGEIKLAPDFNKTPEALIADFEGGD
jgi:prevent-host-death family protein